MARSDYIYAVVDVLKPPGPPVKAFTVKHELVRWWNRLTEAEQVGKEVYRLIDGTWRDYTPVKMDLSNI